MTDLDTIEAVALAATANVRDNGYNIVAPDGEVIFDYKHSDHTNARADAALFSRAREYVLTLVKAVREREAQNATLRAAARRLINAEEAHAKAGTARRVAHALGGTSTTEIDAAYRATYAKLVAARKSLADLVP